MHDPLICRQLLPVEISIFPSNPETQAIRNQQYLNSLLYDENETSDKNCQKCVDELSNVLEFICFQRKKFRKIFGKNNRVIDELNEILKTLRAEKSQKITRLSELEMRLRERENVENVANEILLVGNSPVGIKVLCARYSQSKDQPLIPGELLQKIERQRMISLEYSKDYEKVKDRMTYFKHLNAKIAALCEARREQEFHLKRARDISSGLSQMESKIQERERFILGLENELKRIIPKSKKLGEGFE